MKDEALIYGPLYLEDYFSLIKLSLGLDVRVVIEVGLRAHVSVESIVVTVTINISLNLP